MADTKISGMTSLTQTDVVTTTDVIPIVDIGPPNANKKITPQALVGAAINNLVQTWNDAPTTFTGFKFNITDTASAASSLFMDLQVGGSSRFSVRKDGVLSTAAKANFASVTITLGETGTGEVTVRSTGGFGWSPDATALSTPDTILRRDAANTLAQRNGTAAQTFRVYKTFTDTSNYLRVALDTTGQPSLMIQSAGTGGAINFEINNQTAGAVAIATNGTSRWQINLSGHFIAATDNAYDIGASGATRPRNLYLGGGIFANAAFVLTGNPGGGGATSRYISGAGTTTDWYFNVPTGGTYYFATAEVQRWRIENTGHFLAATDNTYDIGASGANRPRNLYLAGTINSSAITSTASITAGPGSYLKAGNGNIQIAGPSDGVMGIYNSNANDFNRLQFGGTTSAFPALKRSSAEMHVRLADDSNYANLACLDLLSVANVRAQVNTAIPAGGTTGAGLRVSSTANFGVFFGSGAPTLSAAKGSLYLRSDGTTTNDRMYVNTNGSTTWTAVTTAA